MRLTIAFALVLAIAPPAPAQYLACVNLDHVNRQLVGHVVDFTKNHGADRRIFSPILGMPRDLYVYLPPGYDPGRAYPLVLFFHMSNVDEHYFVGSRLIHCLDDLIASGQMPPAIVACPDGSFGGRNLLIEKHSFYINGLGGRFEDHIIQEVMPFLSAHYSIRPEKRAHAILGTSSGAYGALSLGVRHRDIIGAVATLAAPANIRYSNVSGDYFEDFNSATYRWRMRYDPDQVIAVFFLGLNTVRARESITPVFGEDDQSVARVVQTNPADLIFSTDLKPGELDIYLHYGCRDEYNFDAQNQSFAWLAAQKGVEVTTAVDPNGHHGIRYFRDNLPLAFHWLGQHLLPPAPLIPQESVGVPLQVKPCIARDRLPVRGTTRRERSTPL